ncbi:hypothetical protein [Fulvivirga imtechensis]|nr:hypothetical protein [Fulvivirga imtechensis]
MKKMILFLLLSTGVSLQGKAQHFIASFGVEHSWDIPTHISNVVYDHYYGYEWVHASRAYHSGGLFFDVVLQRGDMFVELTIRKDGYITRNFVRDYYPLHDHVCSSHCGYHATYYRTHYKSCHSSHHHGHNHVAYVYRPYGYHHTHSTHYVYKSNGQGHKHGHGTGHNNKGGHGHKHNKPQNHSRPDDDGYRERRDRYHNSRESHYNGDHKGREKGKSEQGRAVYVKRGR